MEEGLETTMETLSRLNSESNDYACSNNCPRRPSLFECHKREEVLEFFSAAKDLQAIIQHLNSTNSSSKKLISAQNLFRVTMKRVGRDFFALLKANKHHINPNASHEDNGHEIDIFTIAYLKLIVDCMMSVGYEKKCLKIYKITRRSIVEDAILLLGHRKMTKSRVQKMDCEQIQLKLNNWLEAARFAVKHIFPGEKILCDNLFSSYSLQYPIKETCFAEACKDPSLFLFKFPGKVAKHSKKSPEMVSLFLQIYDNLSELSHDIDLIFCSDLTIVGSTANSSITRVGDAVRSILFEFESQVQKDTSKAVIPGGGVYPLTCYVMNYLTSLVNYSDALEKILDECYENLQLCLPETYFEDGITSSSVSLWFAWQILLLLCKIDVKSEVYKDAALTYLFLANNLQYVMNKVSGSKLESALGETWIPKHTAKVIQYAINYEKTGWDKVISTLPEDQTSDLPLNKVKECFRRFNDEFEQEYRKQVDWVVLDPNLRKEIKTSLTKQVMDRYRYMYDKYKPLMIKSREKDIIQNVIKFIPEDVESYMSELLDGSYPNDMVSLSSGEEVAQPGSETIGVQRRRKYLRQLMRNLRRKDKDGGGNNSI